MLAKPPKKAITKIRFGLVTVTSRPIHRIDKATPTSIARLRLMRSDSIPMGMPKSKALTDGIALTNPRKSRPKPRSRMKKLKNRFQALNMMPSRIVAIRKRSAERLNERICAISELIGLENRISQVFGFCRCQEVACSKA
jgi:hypothetical protein